MIDRIRFMLSPIGTHPDHPVKETRRGSATMSSGLSAGGTFSDSLGRQSLSLPTSRGGESTA